MKLSGVLFYWSSDSFTMVMGKHIDLTLFGGLPSISKFWLDYSRIPGKLIKTMGGVMNLVGWGRKVIVTIEYTVKWDKKIFDKCT